MSESERFEVELSREARKDLKKHRSAVPAVGNVLSQLIANPELGEALKGDLEGFRSVHFDVKGSGEYRLVYLIEEAERICVVFAIGPREGFYESLKRRVN